MKDKFIINMHHNLEEAILDYMTKVELRWMIIEIKSAQDKKKIHNKLKNIKNWIYLLQIYYAILEQNDFNKLI